TQADRKEMTAPIPPVEYTSSAPSQLEEVPASPPQEPVTHQPATSLPSSSRPEELQSVSSTDSEDFAFSVGDEEEESGFGPAWLKSLGATILDEEEASHLEQSAPSLSPLSTDSGKLEQPAAYASQNAFEAALQEQPVAYDPWKISEPEVQSSAYDPWRTSVSEPQKQPVAHEAQKISDLQEQIKVSEPQPVSSSSAQVEQDLVATLEELEHQLYAKGFVAMEPNSLSAIAQVQEAKSTNTVTPLSTQQTSQPVQETSQKQPLPSALAELGMMFHESDGETSPPVSAAALTPDAADFPAEPLWLQTLRSAPASESDESAASPAFRTPIVSRSVSPVNISQELPNTPQVHMEAMSGLIFEPTPTSASSSAVSKESEATNGQSAHANPFLETELETTMKRPAVRLQSILHSVAPLDTASPSSKVRRSERGESKVGKTTESGDLNYKDRLLKGYQHQLVGDYDEAMQEYRLVIRGAPELLDEVISNLRALLKLAPKYSIACRVLGDAYMRQGEYLQAMEAYNSALTMAKKAKS
ncbi:MAG TPA: hypothetical protein VHV10_00765, partial [Ktedonobacteraceae bacterium]|nr:hypothetical protein [Ktedonobacteraceae bacterium]